MQLTIQQLQLQIEFIELSGDVNKDLSVKLIMLSAVLL